MLEKYFQNIFNTTKAGQVREESYYPDLKQLLENLAEKSGKKYFITALPKRTEGGNPDFRILTAKKELVGYIEAKDPKVENLESVENSEQLKRYRSTFPNLILTNFFEFRLYRHGELIEKVLVGRPFLIHQLKAIPPVENQEKFLAILERFFSFTTPSTTTAKALATELAKRTRFLRDGVITEELEEEKIEGTQTLESYYHAFREHLIPSLTAKDFSNLFAQTITYGLFAARSRASNSFNRELAYKYIPHTIGILHDVFRFISSKDLPQSMEWIIDDIADVLAVSDVKNIMDNFYREGKGRDPIFHFYETFLAEYDPEERKKRGVYYTPEAVVGFIVRSIHKILKDKFQREDGFATSSVTVLDPAAGTLTFPAEAIRQATEEFKKKYGAGGIANLMRDHILKNFYALEIMMAPYAVGHLKIGFVLTEHGYKLSEDERFHLYLTNTLDFTKEDQARFPGIFEQTIAKESQEAMKVKAEIPIMVVMGNPPYSGISENKGEWILGKIDDYKKVDGQPLGERNPKWLQDDYVKFYRFAQWKIEQNGMGVLGFITNHAWLDNPTFRGMRRSLMQTFDEIYLLNLHGSTLKKEMTPEGAKDENVFDIQPGVAIGIFVKYKKSTKEKKIYYTDQWGLREEKYTWLEKHDFGNTEWQELLPVAPTYYFVPKNTEGLLTYQNYMSVQEIFPVNSVGIVTARDEFVIDFGKTPLEVRMRAFRDASEGDEFIESAYGIKDKPTFHWYIKDARKKLKDTKNWEEYFMKILYRPFDERWIYYHPAVIERTREEVMQHMLKPNLALLAKRQQKQEFSYAFVSDKITESCVFESAYANNTVFPLYLYPIKKNKKQASLLGIGEKDNNDLPERANINPQLIASLEKLWGRNYFWKQPGDTSFQALDIFYYIYAILYASAYRDKYAEFLKTDFPRVPFTADYNLFKKLAKLGEKLVYLHLLKSDELKNPIAKFSGTGDSLVEKPEYKEKEKRVYINGPQFFENIESVVWNYHIGGYQVLQKWLKDRKGRILSSEDIKHYCLIVTALSGTSKLQKEIDKLYPEIEKNLIKL